MRIISILAAAAGRTASVSSSAATTYISCDFRPTGEIVAYNIDPAQKTVRDTGSFDLKLRVIEFTDERIIFETDNLFYGYTFNLKDGMASSSRVTINRVTGLAYATLTRKRADFHSDLCLPNSGWTCMEPGAMSDARGTCRPTHRKF
jgi:hypothetical protein